MEGIRSRPWSGAAYIVVVALLLGFTVQVYRKAMPWQDTVEVTMMTTSAGLGLNPRSDVKLQGMLVGEVRDITSDGMTAKITMALDPELVSLIPRNVDAAIIPKTLFGEKFVDLRIPSSGGVGQISAGTEIEQSSTAVELGAIFAKLDPLLRDLRPDKLSAVLNAFATGLDGNGATLGSTLRNLEKTLTALEPELGNLVAGLRATGATAEVYAAATPDLVRVLDAATVLSNDLLVPQEQAFADFLAETITTASVARKVLSRNARQIVTLTGEARPVLELLRDYAGALPCFIDGLHTVDTLANQAFASRGPYLDLVIDSFTSKAPYTHPDDLPTNPRSDAHDQNLPRGVPDWDPHCPAFRADALAVKDLKPFAFVGSSTTSSSRSAGTSAPEPAVADARRVLARLTAARLLGIESDAVPDYAGLLIEPLMSGTLEVP